MKKFLMAVAVLACMSTLAFAGPNVGGKLVAHDANLLMSATDGLSSVCGQGNIPPACDNIDTRIDGALPADPAVFKVYAAFPQGSAPRLLGLTWGVLYDPNVVVLTNWFYCGNFELNDPNWPASGSGSSVTYDVPQTGLLTPVYWFMGYNYNAVPGQLTLGPNPSQGGWFGDDTVPSQLDPIAGYGAIGFDTDGVLNCPTIVTTGACCDPATGACQITEPAACAPPFIFHSEFQTCEPNQCPQPLQGACCASDGTCTFVTQAQCTGTYLGDTVPCDPNPCALTGACCAADLTCTITTQADCVGTYMGDGTICEANTCVVPVEPTTWGSIKNIYSK